MKTLAFVSIAALAAVMTATAASAATQVELKDMAARVVVQPENRSDVELKVVYGAAKVPVIMVHTDGDTFVADGKLWHKHLDCRDNNSVNIDGLGTVAMADLPTVYVKVPMDAKVSAGGATFGTLGNSTTLEFNQGGCGDWKVGDVAGKSEVNIGGSGNVTAGAAADAEINIGGSGNYTGGNVASLEANIGGNGDIDLDSVNGRLEVNIGGSGDVKVADGKAPHLEVNIAGSGDVRFGGTADDVDVSIVGSGDVRIKAVTGNISKTVMGSGSVIVGQ